MFKESYERKLKGNNLILTECEPVEDKSLFEERMITENNIKGFLPCKIRTDDGDDSFVYDITSKQSLRQIYEDREMNEADIRKLISGLVNVQQQLENYLLSDENVILNPSYIYVDPETKIPAFVFYPYYKAELQDSLMQLGTFVLEKTNHNDEKAVYIAYGFYKRIISEEYSFDTLLAGKYEGGQTDAAANPINLNQRQMGNRGDDTYKSVNAKAANPLENINTSDIDNSKLNGGKGNGEKIAMAISLSVLMLLTGMIVFFKYYGSEYLEGVNPRFFICCAGIMGAASVTVPLAILINRSRIEGKRKRLREIEKDVYEENSKKSRAVYSLNSRNKRFGVTGELNSSDIVPKRLVCYEGSEITEFRIGSDSFLIGKSQNEVDGVLDNEEASRIHAKVYKRNGDYYIMDQNSTNGTAVNGRMLTANESVKLCGNDEISFAGKVFYFR